MGILQVIKSPVSGMRGVAERGAGPGFVTILLWTGVSLLVAGLGLLLGGLVAAGEVVESLPPGAVPPELDEQALESAVVTFQFIGIGARMLWPIVYWPILTLLMYLVTRFFGGGGTLAGMFGAMGAACGPFVLLGLLKLPIIGAQQALGSGAEPGAASAALGTGNFLLTLGAIAWHVALVIVGGAAARGISYGRSGGSCAISCATAVGVPLLLLILLSVILAVTGAAGG